MGHTRLGKIPKTRKWRDVVGVFAGADAEGRVAEIAQRTLAAAEPALLRAVGDEGLRLAFHALAKLALASRDAEWTDALGRLGISLPASATIFDLAASMHALVDDEVLAKGASTDVGEVALRAMGQTLLELAGPSSTTLFGSDTETLRSAVRELSTKKGFSEVGQRFFGHFLARFLNSYISRIAADATGGRSIGEVATLAHFNAELTHHCIQSARILRDFCGEWYSKTEYVQGIDRHNAARFVAVAVEKLASELRQQGAHE